MDDEEGATSDVLGPGPVVCHRCGARWGEDRAFLPERSRARDGAWSWTCVRCAIVAERGPR